jgi:8-oxo-dGTP pyrophosphatase MutT (NUDIX family)
MSGLCNHTSVGVLARREDRYALFQRAKYPIAKAPCAGHVDELDGVPTGARSEEPAYRAAGVRELEEETGLTVRGRDLQLVLTAMYRNACRRRPVDGGSPWHLWLVYSVTIGPGQRAKANGHENTDLRWYTPQEIAALGDLEPVWRTMLTQIRII